MSTPSARTNRRRQLQTDHNTAHGITPRTIEKAIREIPAGLRDAPPEPGVAPADVSVGDLPATIDKLRAEMLAAAGELDFERAAILRDQIRDLEQLHLDLG